MDTWIVYILECRDKTLYTGITNQIEKRLRAHEQGSASKYTRGRNPVTLVYQESHPTRASALRREAAIKGMNRQEKKLLIGVPTCASKKAPGERSR